MVEGRLLRRVQPQLIHSPLFVTFALVVFRAFTNSAFIPQKYATTGAPTGCDQYTSMDCLRALYNFHYDLKVPDKHSIGVGMLSISPALVFTLIRLMQSSSAWSH